MNAWKCIAAAFVVWLICFSDKSEDPTRRSAVNSYDASSYSSDYPNPVVSSGGSHDKPDGDYDCTVTNQTRALGPYTLTCEKDGDEIKIRFPNGGYIVVDEDGFHAARGEQWGIELD